MPAIDCKDRSVNLLLLMHAPFAEETMALARRLVKFGEIRSVANSAGLRAAIAEKRWDLLLAFGTGEIVPTDVLQTPSLCAINVHAASPSYPGRDPHHFAAYDGVAEYGATLHYMTPVVDQGPIVNAELCSVQVDASPQQLLACGNAAGLRLVKKFLEGFDPSVPPSKGTEYQWARRVRKRKDFVELCHVNAQMSYEEFSRRRRAVAMPGYANLWTDVHGHRFRIETPTE